MAFNAKKISPLDLPQNAQIAVGVDIPINAPAVFKSNYTTQAAIKNNLINYFMTNRGERPFNPSFGSGIRTQVFEQISQGTISNIENIIKNDLALYFNNINVQKIEVLGYEDNNQITINIYYNIQDFGISDNISVTY
jgi:phage baseplate assembly protein W